MATKLERQVKEYIASAVEGYLNGIYNDDYEPMARDGWKDYVLEGLRIDIEHGLIVNGEEFKHLYFAGKAEIERMTYKYIDTYKDVQPYVIR